MKLLIFDTEATGIENAELIEFGGLYFDASDTANDLDKQILIEEKRFRMKPDQPILPSSTVIHGITQKKADEWEPCFKVVPILHKFLMNIIDNEIVTFVGQNISYDVNVLNSSFKKYGLQEIHFQQFFVIDTRRLARYFIPKNNIGGYSLDAIYYYLFPDRLDSMFEKRSIHSAVTDCWLTYDVLMGIEEEICREESNIFGSSFLGATM